MKLFVLLTLLTLCYTDKFPGRRQGKRSYVCPPNFIRLSHRCYFFSKEEASWHNAFHKCKDLHGNLAVIKNPNQDKLIRKTLSKRTLKPLERWLGAIYDWKQMAWKWAASGKPLSYQGFAENQTEEVLKWQCLILDPQLQFKWSTRNCYQEKHFICHTKLKLVNGKGKKKLLKQYNVDKFNKLNEIPVPSSNSSDYKEDLLAFQHNNSLYAMSPKPIRKRKNKNNTSLRNNAANRRRRFKNREHDKIDGALENVEWRTYYGQRRNNNPLYPLPIVEEYNFIKEP